MKPLAYLDTSLYVRQFVEEAGAKAASRLLSRYSLASSFLLQVEAVSVVSRKRAEGNLSDKEIERIQDEVLEGLRHISFVVLDGNVAGRGRNVVSNHGLRSLDAVHLGTAILLRESLGAEIPFLTVDARLAGAARREGFKVIEAE